MPWGNIAGAGLEVIGDLWAGSEARKAAREAAQRNYEMQKEFAQNGIQWRVADAKAARLHPLAALGMQPAQASPSFVVEGTNHGATLKNLGQNVSRAARATASPEERIADQLRIENMRLQNDLLKQQIIAQQNSQVGPPMPTGGSSNFIPGQGDSGVMLVKPSERTASASGRPAQEAGWRPDVSYSRTDTGLVPVIPQGLSESMEDDMVGKLLWRMRNQIMPNFTGGSKPSSAELPKGATDWKWDKFKQEWVPHRPGERSFIREVGEKFRYGR